VRERERQTRLQMTSPSVRRQRMRSNLPDISQPQFFQPQLQHQPQYTYAQPPPPLLPSYIPPAAPLPQSHYWDEQPEQRRFQHEQQLHTLQQQLMEKQQRREQREMKKIQRQKEKEQQKKQQKKQQQAEREQQYQLQLAERERRQQQQLAEREWIHQQQLAEHAQRQQQLLAEKEWMHHQQLAEQEQFRQQQLAEREYHHQQQLAEQQHHLQQQLTRQEHQRQQQQAELDQQLAEQERYQQEEQALQQQLGIQYNINQLPMGRRPYHEPSHRHTLGPMNISCSKCNALHFISERLTASSMRNPKFGTCCLQGQISLPYLTEPPPVLQSLLTASTARARGFREKIRRYNCAFAFTSVAVNVDEERIAGTGPTSFRIHGELSHKMGSLLPSNDTIQPLYAQLYIHDPQAALDYRIRRNNVLNPDVMSDLQDMLNQSHIYVPLYKHAYQIIMGKPEEERANIRVAIALAPDTDHRVYNLPTVDEVAAIVPSESDNSTHSERDIIVRLRGGPLKRISHLHPAYSPLHYVLLFPRGESGWHQYIPTQQSADDAQRSKNVTQRCYYAFRLHPRLPTIEASTLFRARRLFQQYVVDAYSSVEASELFWVRNNQKTIRADLYKGIHDTVADSDQPDLINLAEQGRPIILPASHSGSPRHMFQLFQDAMAICRKNRKPDLFVTMTANPNWPDIVDALLDYDLTNNDDPDNTQRKQTALDRPDIVARVFKKKMDALLKKIKEGYFGDVSAYLYVIEFQKRGLPHMHLLIFLREQHKIHDAPTVDQLISAQIPDPVTQPMLYQTVTKCMLHGPCGPNKHTAPCMVNGICSKHFPKPFCEQTQFGNDGYPEYARPNNGHTFTHPTSHFVFDNRWVVPYNPGLSAEFDCHVNVEVCASIKSVKYIHKYIYKGPDRATLEVGDKDEIKQFIDARHNGPVDSCWKLFEFAMHAEFPSVYRLPVHLENEQTVYFTDADDAQAILDRPSSQKTMLTEWFVANTVYPDAKNHFYVDFPSVFVWNKKTKIWRPRKSNFVIGRLMFASPSQGERFYLRTLLTVVKGATSFADLRSFDGVQFHTYKAACLARGLLEDDGEWNQCLQEAGEMQVGSQLRSLFATILIHCIPAQPEVLWVKHRDKICDDVKHLLIARDIPDPSDIQIYDYGLHLLGRILFQSGRYLSDFPPMPLPLLNWAVAGNSLLQEQLNYNHLDLFEQVEYNMERFNPEQRLAYDAVMDSVINNKGKIFFLHSAGGGGKTFVCITIASAVRSKAKVALCVASSGIASLLLPGGRTAHSQLKIPINPHEASTCKIDKNTLLHDVILETAIIIWDEAPMQNRFAFEAVDKTLQDLRRDTRPFGGITMLFGGDFRQIPPVVPRGSREAIVNASLTRSPLWRKINMLYLVTNMRLISSPENAPFAAWLLDIGAGRNIHHGNLVDLIASMHLPQNNSESLIDAIYPDITTAGKPDQYFLDRTILAPRNDEVDVINQSILNSFPGEEVVLNSVDKAVMGENQGQNQNHYYTTEYLNSLTASGFPLARLALKPACPLMLLRNIDAPNGLCNGTRMVLIRVRMRVLECRILGGVHAGKIAFIPRLTMETSDEQMPIPLSRRQFPVRLAFAMTINKSQGQSVSNVGIHLGTPVFSHGQLYVALSRCTSANNIKVLFPPLPEGSITTTNVVYPEVCCNTLTCFKY
jgi:hypothetical protein